MFAETLRAAIDGARTLNQLDDLSRALWQGHGSGALADDEAQSLAEHLAAVRTARRSSQEPVGIPPGRKSLFPPRRYQRSPDRSASIARRRGIAAASPMPPALASRFTVGQLAVLAIVADEVAQHGTCSLCVDAIAARAGVCRRLAQTAIRLAEGDGLLIVQERRRTGAKSETNVVRLLSREWIAWTRRRPRRAYSVQIAAPHGEASSRPSSSWASGPSRMSAEGQSDRSVGANQARCREGTGRSSR